MGIQENVFCVNSNYEILIWVICRFGIHLVLCYLHVHCREKLKNLKKTKNSVPWLIWLMHCFVFIVSLSLSAILVTTIGDIYFKFHVKIVLYTLKNTILSFWRRYSQKWTLLTNLVTLNCTYATKKRSTI